MEIERGEVPTQAKEKKRGFSSYTKEEEKKTQTNLEERAAPDSNRQPLAPETNVITITLAAQQHLLSFR